jgi:prepilin-type N-terminal cleavage/methylation domain-containing protein
VRGPGGQAGLTLVELLLALAISTVVLATLASMVRSAAAANAVTMSQLEVQQQARFAVRRIVSQVRLAKSGALPSKTDPASSGSWLSPISYDLRAGTSAGTLALVESQGGVNRVIAEPVTYFSITSPDPVAGQTLVEVAVTVGQGEISASASGSARLGGVR